MCDSYLQSKTSPDLRFTGFASSWLLDRWNSPVGNITLAATPSNTACETIVTIT